MGERDDLTEIMEAIASSETLDSHEIFERLISASKLDDAGLGAEVRKVLPMVALSVLALAKQLDKQDARRPRGRPTGVEFAGRDCWRAYVAWLAVRFFGNPMTSNRDAIALARKLSAALGLAGNEQAFYGVSEESLEQSLSRGRSRLGMVETPDGRWKCEHCEKVLSMK